MVIIASKEGQLANRIWHASSFIANAFENDYRILHLYIDEYSHFFSERLNSTHHPLRIAGKKSKWRNNFLRKFFEFVLKFSRRTSLRKFLFFDILLHEGYDDVEPFDLNNVQFIHKAKSGNLVVSGWLFKDSMNLKKHKEKIVELWTPNVNYRNRIDNFYKRYHEISDLLIGVHIRRGDYIKFNNGTWYYEIADYHRKMKEIAAMSEFSGKKLGFVVCSNEPDTKFTTEQQFDIFFEPRHFIEDLYLLSRCDYIIGPPSTFSMWASFYGSVPLYMLRDITVNVDMKKFQIHF